jgi:methionyl-tRNA synthetase
MAKSTFYITTPIYYVNDVPHIGHAYTTVAADFIARYHRLAGDKVFFLTGTDEHGQKVARAAEERGLDPQKWSDEMVPRWIDVWKRLEISYDDFIRTTETRHVEPVRRLFEQLHEQGDIYLGHYEGLYCVACETFYREAELVNGLCPIHERPVEVVTEDNYFFRLSAYTDRLLELYERHPVFVRPEARRNEVVSFVKAGLEDISVSRTSFSWGIPLPWDPEHVMYVWVDALQNYITAAGYGSDDERFADTWPADYQLIGKDILRHHAVIWPALLMAADIPLPKTVFAHGFLTVGGKKMSKTNLTGISPHELIDAFTSDGYRYHFLREGVFGQDGSFSWEAMAARYNADLANDLGNLLSRTLAMVENYFDSVVPAAGDEESAEVELRSAAKAAAAELDSGVRSLDFASALEGVMQFVRAANHYVNAQAPWNLAKDPDQRGRLATILYAVCEALRQIGVLISPAMPSAARRISEQLGLKERDFRIPAELEWGGLPAGTKVTKGESLFPRVDLE